MLWAVNNEGLSSHTCTNAILDAIDRVPTFALLQLGTGLRLQAGNRGRVDVNVHVSGQAAHSSAPHLGLSAIDGSNAVLNRLHELTWPDDHPVLGRRHAIGYKVRYEPLAPHTLPADAYIAVDRRLLPGDDPDAAADEIRQHLKDISPWGVEVTRGYYMLPALIDVSNPLFQGLQESISRVHGRAPDIYYGQGTFDAGGPAARGVPTVMYGASGGDWPTGVDFVPIPDLEAEARTLADFIVQTLA